MKLFTVVVSPRHASYGTASYGLFRSRTAAQVEMERRVREELEDDGTYDDEEIEEYIALDAIDLPSASLYVSPVYLDCGEVTATQIF